MATLDKNRRVRAGGCALCGQPAGSLNAAIRRILSRLESVSIAMPFGFGAFLQRMRSSSLTIGQITFGGFLLVLAIIVTTSVASVVAVRHLDNTFAELQRLDSVGDLAAEIDRRMNELRLAARDYVTDPTAQSSRVWGAASSLNVLLKKTRIELAPEQQDGARPALLGLDQREGFEQLVQRAEAAGEAHQRDGAHQEVHLA